MRAKNRHYMIYHFIVAGFLLLFSFGCDKDDPPEPPVIGNISVSGITSNTAFISGSIENDGGAAITDKGVVWNTSGNPALDNNEGKTGLGSGDGNISVTLTGLFPGTRYYVRGYATNSEGAAYSNQIDFTTEGQLAEVTTAEVREITYSSAVSGGEVTDEGGLEVTARGIVLSTSENPDLEDNEQITEDGGGPGEFTSQLEELLPSTTYYIRAYATNSLGTSYGQQETFETISNDGFPCPDMPTFTDPRDDNVYNTVIIGGQCWLKENLRYLPEVYPSSDDSETEARYYVMGYQGTSVSSAKENENYQNYGVLYNWPASLDACPAGWHLPAGEEWTQLIDYLGEKYGISNTDDVDGTGNALKSCRQEDSPLGGECNTHEHPRWNSNNTHYGTDQFNFSALPGGYLFPGGVQPVGYGGYWWTSTEQSENFVIYGSMRDYKGDVNFTTTYKDYAFSVRCVRDE